MINCTWAVQWGLFCFLDFNFHSSVSLKMFVNFIFIVKILVPPKKPNFVQNNDEETLQWESAGKMGATPCTLWHVFCPQGRCYNGECKTRDSQCQYIWGTSRSRFLLGGHTQVSLGILCCPSCWLGVIKTREKKKPRKGWREWWIIVIKPQQTTADVEDLSSEPNSAIHWLWPWQNGCHTHLLRLGWVQWSCSLSIHLGNFLYTLDLTFTASS